MFIFFFNDTATTEIYTLSLHDALPISLCDHLKIDLAAYGVAGLRAVLARLPFERPAIVVTNVETPDQRDACVRSEEHTSELQSRQYLVCRLLLEKKKK